jgi:hypothetical protein
MLRLAKNNEVCGNDDTHVTCDILNIASHLADVTGDALIKEILGDLLRFVESSLLPTMGPSTDTSSHTQRNRSMFAEGGGCFLS